MSVETETKENVKVDADGTRRYLNDDGMLHRVDGPAVECSNGSKMWYIDGELHREDGPAIESKNGDKYWAIDGKFHRTDGPAVELADGTTEWYTRGTKQKK